MKIKKLFISIKNFFRNIKIGFIRLFKPPLPEIDCMKNYGNSGENDFVSELKKHIPNCKIKQNIIINTVEGNAEIDCLVLFERKLFAIEVKRWKGMLIETNNGFVQEKRDRYTDEIHTKLLKSPFTQLNRASMLLKKQIRHKVWINNIVFFADKSFEGIKLLHERLWFSNINSLCNYILNDGKLSDKNEVTDFFDACIAADSLFSSNRTRSLRCVICESSLRFDVSERILSKKDIFSIKISHFWARDDLEILLNNGDSYNLSVENGKIVVFNGVNYVEYALCKLCYILIGNNI